jgi:glycerol kinase
VPLAVLALDQGTTSSRSIVFDREGRIISTANAEFPQLYPRPGWVEHDPHQIWRSQLATARAAYEQATTSGHAIAAVGITNQRETTIVWDRTTAEPVYNAIVWQDRRTAPLCESLRAAGWERQIAERTGLRLDPSFSGTKLAWLLDNINGLRARAERGELAFGTVDTYLLFRLTGGHVHATDTTNASRTLLLNINTLDWDDDILMELRIPRAMLPEVRPSSGFVGHCDTSLFGTALPITGIAGDQQAATFGQACFTPGMAKQTYGTGSFMLMNTGNVPTPSTHGLLTTVAWTLGTDTTYALEGYSLIAGAGVQWLRDALGVIGSAAETSDLALSVSSTGGVYFVPAFAGLGAPWWDTHARGTIVGLTRGSGRAELTRAVLESVAFQTRDVLDAMESDSGIAMSELRVDGGMVANEFLMQFQADILGRRVVRPAVTETTALGAAYLAGLAAGVWSDTSEITANWCIDRQFDPNLAGSDRLKRIERWHDAVERSRAWAEDSGE